MADLDAHRNRIIVPQKQERIVLLGLQHIPTLEEALPEVGCDTFTSTFTDFTASLSQPSMVGSVSNARPLHRWRIC